MTRITNFSLWNVVVGSGHLQTQKAHPHIELDVTLKNSESSEGVNDS